jgi:hypothetical protein
MQASAIGVQKCPIYSIGVYLTTEGFEFNKLVIDRQTTHIFVDSVID